MQKPTSSKSLTVHIFLKEDQEWIEDASLIGEVTQKVEASYPSKKLLKSRSVENVGAAWRGEVVVNEESQFPVNNSSYGGSVSFRGSRITPKENF